LQGVLYLYKNILKKDVGWLDDIKKANRLKHLPVVFSKKETIKIFEYLEGTPKLIISLLYGGGLRLSEALRLRIKDIDFDYQQIIVRDGKGEKDRHTVLPASIIPELKKHLNEVFKQHKKDLADGKGTTILPYALDRKYPNANKEFGWQYAFPSDIFVQDKNSELYYRFHVHESTIQRAVKVAIKMINGAAILTDKERETALNTHRLQSVVSHNTILSANEQMGFITLILLFFCSFTDKILNS
jgi:integrase